MTIYLFAIELMKLKSTVTRDANVDRRTEWESSGQVVDWNLIWC